MRSCGSAGAACRDVIGAAAQARRAEGRQRRRRSRRNERLASEVRDLKEGLEMVEEKARVELGMVKPDEILVQVSPVR